VLLALVGAVYVLGAVRIDALFGLDSDWLAPPQVAAAALAALAFQPARAGLMRLIDRAVYGRRLPAYEALARVSELAWAGSGGTEALRRLAEVTARVLGVEYAAVHVATPQGRELIYRWPNCGQVRSAAQRIPVTYQGIIVGSLVVPAMRGPVPRQRQALLDDLSRSAGVVLRNTAITFELEQRLEAAEAHSAAMRASRWRIVAAQDSERRDLERDLHDAAQPALTSVRLTLGLLNHLATTRNDDAYGTTLDHLRTQIRIAADALRQTLRSIDPPVLTQAGIVPALKETAESLRLDVSFRIGASVDEVRFARHVEATVYYCCAEALQNCAKHSPGAEVELALDREGDGRLSFQVSDRGPGFEMASISTGSGLQNMADRLAAAGGELSINSRPGEGTRVRGTVPTNT
jgi:signal transduction histidine kinase